MVNKKNFRNHSGVIILSPLGSRIEFFLTSAFFSTIAPQHRERALERSCAQECLVFPVLVGTNYLVADDGIPSSLHVYSGKNIFEVRIVA